MDDQEENRYLLEALLKGNGHDVQSVANGAEALQRLKSGGIDLIVSDILMPVMASARRTDIVTTPQQEEEVLKLYSERLVRKLEQKMLQLEKEVKRRQAAEETLRINARKYRLLADNTLDVIWAMSSLELVFTYVNPAIRDFTGYSQEEWIGSRLPEHCDKENLANIPHAETFGSTANVIKEPYSRYTCRSALKKKW